MSWEVSIGKNFKGCHSTHYIQSTLILECLNWALAIANISLRANTRLFSFSIGFVYIYLLIVTSLQNWLFTFYFAFHRTNPSKLKYTTRYTRGRYVSEPSCNSQTATDKVRNWPGRHGEREQDICTSSWWSFTIFKWFPI